MPNFKTHIACYSSLISVDKSGCNNCDICGGEPTQQNPVLQLRIQRVLIKMRQRKPYNDLVMVSIHSECVTVLTAQHR